MSVLEVIGWISVAAWVYVALAMAAYRVLYYLAYPFERVQLALLWPVAPVLLLARRFSMRRRHRLARARIAREEPWRIN